MSCYKSATLALLLLQHNPTFVGAGVAELILAFASVAYLSLRAATLNPSKVLKDE